MQLDIDEHEVMSNVEVKRRRGVINHYPHLDHVFPIETQLDPAFQGYFQRMLNVCGCLKHARLPQMISLISSFGDVSLCLKSSKEHLQLFCRLKCGIPA